MSVTSFHLHQWWCLGCQPIGWWPTLKSHFYILLAQRARSINCLGQVSQELDSDMVIFVRHFTKEQPQEHTQREWGEQVWAKEEIELWCHHNRHLSPTGSSRVEIVLQRCPKLKQENQTFLLSKHSVIGCMLWVWQLQEGVLWSWRSNMDSTPQPLRQISIRSNGVEGNGGGLWWSKRFERQNDQK